MLLQLEQEASGITKASSLLPWKFQWQTFLRYLGCLSHPISCACLYIAFSDLSTFCLYISCEWIFFSLRSQQELERCLRPWTGTQELDRIDWSRVSLDSLTIGDPAASSKEMGADDYLSLDVAQMLLAPRLQSFSLFCNRIQLHKFSEISRQTLEARKFTLRLMCRAFFSHDESAWLQSLGLKLTRKIKADGERTAPYWEYSSS